jgi:hypothetical protein
MKMEACLWSVPPYSPILIVFVHNLCGNCGSTFLSLLFILSFFNIPHYFECLKSLIHPAFLGIKL